MMSIEAADEAMVGQQVKYCQDYMMLIHFWLCYESGWLVLDGKSFK